MAEYTMENFYKIYIKAYNNAVEFLSEAKIMLENKHYARAYFLAYTGLEEISKSQLAADVYTGLISENVFWNRFRHHGAKLEGINWAYEDANEFPYNQIWLGPGKNDINKIAPTKPLWEKRQKSLYVDICNKDVIMPSQEFTQDGAMAIIHILDTAVYRIMEVTEYYGHQIGTKGFIK